MLNTTISTDLQKVVTSSSNQLVDLPVKENTFNENKVIKAQPEQVGIQQMKISYPKNGLYGLL